MKLNFNLMKKEANFEADIEGVIEKNLEYKSKNPDKKIRYQIKQEEKRKNEELKQKNEELKIEAFRKFEESKQEEQRKYEELKHKHDMQKKILIIGAIILIVIISLIASALGMV